jgi:hypothetical protein
MGCQKVICFGYGMLHLGPLLSTRKIQDIRLDGVFFIQNLCGDD